MKLMLSVTVLHGNGKLETDCYEKGILRSSINKWITLSDTDDGSDDDEGSIMLHVTTSS